MSKPDRYDLAARCVEEVCNDRRGMHWDFDDELKAELRNVLAIMIRHAVDGTEPVAPYEALLFGFAKRKWEEEAKAGGAEP